ncbi:hypothetical protein llap_5229 [Limosa lapponica baueri]|uniref:Uncharacterized protein n=1 Tax=Limosa lapponica baueri TaxID=1758121 RepID=A0A2I0UEI5_LIMLA|nr:hypothetical protein llap_5229 [Limosa lapponica baueri]
MHEQNGFVKANRLDTPSSLSLSSQDLFSRPLTSSVALLWTRSSPSMLNTPSSLSLSSQDFFSRALTSSVALLWTCSSPSMSFLWVYLVLFQTPPLHLP